MRVLIDECVDPRVKLLFGDHNAATVHEQGWDALEDGPLLTVAQKAFDVLVTIDGSIEFQQNLSKFQIGIVVVHVPKNQKSITARFGKNCWPPLGKLVPARRSMSDALRADR